MRKICEEGMDSKSVMWLGGGGRYDLLRPNKANISLDTIIHSLAQQCRYNGQGVGHYSVAEHSVRVSMVCGEYPLEALMHDAAEAFVGDMVRPMFNAMGPDATARFKEIEQISIKAIFEKYELCYPVPCVVKEMDDLVLMDELNAFRKGRHMGRGLDAHRAEGAFWQRWRELTENQYTKGRKWGQ